MSLRERLRTRLSALAYGVAIPFARLLCFVFARWEVVGVDRVPPHGPVVLVANHNHVIDPPLVAAASRRRVHPMAKQELFDVPVLGWGIALLGAFPVRRFAGDVRALRTARAYLRTGDVVLMFPEGTRAGGRGMQPALPGAAALALLANAPVVPVAISGSHVRLPHAMVAWARRRRPHIRVAFAEPVDLATLRNDERAAEVTTDLLMRRIAALLPEDQRGVYGAGTEGTVVVRRATGDERYDIEP